MADLIHKIEAELARTWRGGGLGVAVSGGGDSVALMHIAAAWADRRGVPLEVATVDHGLRSESAAEAAGVAIAAAELKLRHTTLRWDNWDGRGNLQAEARNARRRLLADWARGRGLKAVLLGHTMDDQAETVLMRLGRGAGVDGLSGMLPAVDRDGLRWLRPMLGVRRTELRGWLQEQSIGWVDDPSNEDERFERVKARKALDAVAPLGISAEGLAETASRLQDAREGLDYAAAELASEAAEWGLCGELRLRLTPLRAAPRELTRRILRAGLTGASGAEYGPRAGAEQKLISAMFGLKLGGGRSLHGCLIRPDGPDRVVIVREAAAVTAQRAPLSQQPVLWDGRFRLAASAPQDGADIAPLGEVGARRLTKLAEDGAWTAPDRWSLAPRGARLTTPALWRGEALVAAPLASYGDALTAEFAKADPSWVDPSPETA
ncbi:MAG: tRNA lysidine(34) synthetase TilS [Pseudomonadota bacterium]